MQDQPIIQFTPDTLAKSISMRPATLMRKMHDMGYRYGRHDVLPEEVIKELVAKYSTPHPQRPDEVVEQAKAIYQQFNLQINIDGQQQNRPYVSLEDRLPLSMSRQSAQQPSENSDGHPDGRTVTQTVSDGTDNVTDGKQTVPDGGRMVTVLAYMAFVFILIFQMEHVASVGMDVSTFSDSTARKVSGWLFAFTFNLTALVMTVKRGIRAKIRLFGRDVSYILLFALLDVIFFVISSGPIGEASNSLMWGKSLLVGSATAFVIYSFNELVTSRS